MNKISEGYFYDVYDLGNNRVLKKKRSLTEIAESIKGKSGMGILKKYWKAYLHIIESNKMTKEMRKRFSHVPLVLFGNPSFKNNTDYEQDKVVLLMDYFDTHLLEENMIMVDKYIELIKELMKYGIHDYVYKFKNSYGINIGSEVIFIDFNEVAFSKEKVLELAKEEKWRQEAQFRKYPEGELKKYLTKKFAETLRGDIIEELWETKI